MARRTSQPPQARKRNVLIDTERQERAWRAIKEFNKLTSTFTSFARALTGNSEVVVRAHATESATDGRVIYISPPIALGDRLGHDRALCEVRDPSTKMKECAACATRELLMRRIYHEIAHIIFKSMDKPLTYLRNRIVRMINDWHPSDVCDHQMDLLPKARTANNYLALGEALNPYILALTRCYEDARVDSKMYRVRPGLKAPTEASLTHTFTQGIQRPNETVFWKDAPLEAQITIGLLVLGMGLDIREGWLSEEAREHLADPELRTMSERALFAGSAANAFELSLDVFEYLQTVGLLLVPKCRPTPSLPNSQDEENKNESDPGDSSSDPGDQSSDQADSGDSGESDSGSPGESGSRETDDGASDSDSRSGADDPEGDDSFENEDSSHGGDDQQDGDTSEESGETGPPSNDKSQESSSEEQDGDGMGNEGDDEGSTDESSSDSGASSSSEKPGDLDEEPTDGDATDEATGIGSDDEGSQSDDNESNGGSAAHGFDPSEDGETDEFDGDSESNTEPELEDGPVGGDPSAASSDEDKSQEEGAAPPSPELKGKDVWDEENRQREVIAAEVVDLLNEFHGHGKDEELDAELLGDSVPMPWDQEADAQAMSMAVVQGPLFDTFSGTVNGLEVITYPDEAFKWGPSGGPYFQEDLPVPEEFMVDERIIGRTLRDARVVFTENKRAKHERGLKSGRVNPAVLGRRAPVQDDRLFQKKRRPGKRDYEFVIGVDVSGSTQAAFRLERIKRAVFAQAELLHRLDVKFSIYAHTGGWDRKSPWSWSNRNNGYQVWILKIKGPNEAWGRQPRTRLAHLRPLIENLDGHTIEFYRKQLEKSQATDRILLYYTDGEMPAANKYEELDILQRELGELDRRGIIKLAVGINTDSPSRYGFDTVQVDCDEDLVKVVTQLRRYLL
jgi:hypothetical protein